MAGATHALLTAQRRPACSADTVLSMTALLLGRSVPTHSANECQPRPRARPNCFVRPRAASGDCSTSGRDESCDEGRRERTATLLQRRTIASALAISAVTLGSHGVFGDRAQAAEDQAGADFYSKWTYIQPSDILPYLEANSTPGDIPSIIRAMDTFATKYPMYKLSHEKGELLSGFVRDAKPKLALEIGTFLGYSALWTAQSLPPGGRLVCVEASQQNADVARQVLKLGKVDDKVEIIVGLGASVIPSLPKALAGAPGAAVSADFVFLDHCKECYLKDLNALETLGLIRKGTVVVADNVIYPGAPDFLQWVDSAGGLYTTKLYDAAFEYEQVWNKDWELKKKDAMSYSVRVVA